MQLSAVSPGSFQFTNSVVLFAIVLVGGQASVPGVLLGTVMMFVVPQIFTDLAQYRYLVFGIAMIAVMVLRPRSEEHTSELQSLMRISYAVFCLKKKKKLSRDKNIYDQIKIITKIIITR